MLGTLCRCLTLSRQRRAGHGVRQVFPDLGNECNSCRSGLDDTPAIVAPSHRLPCCIGSCASLSGHTLALNTVCYAPRFAMLQVTRTLSPPTARRYVCTSPTPSCKALIVNGTCIVAPMCSTSWAVRSFCTWCDPNRSRSSAHVVNLLQAACLGFVSFPRLSPVCSACPQSSPAGCDSPLVGVALSPLRHAASSEG